MNITTQTKNKDFQGKLLRPVEDLLASEQFKATMRDITRNNRLRIDEAGALENEIGLVLIGLEQPQRFVANIAAHAHLPNEKAIALAEDVNREIFMPLREELKKLWNEGPDKKGGGFEEKDTAEHLDRDELMKELERPENSSGELLGLERSMPRDVKSAQSAKKVGGTKPGPFVGASKIAEEKMTQQMSSSSGYRGVDPYRESIE